MPIEYVKTVNVEYTSVEVAYLEWVGKTIEELKQQNADLLDALKETQGLLDNIYAEDVVSSGDLNKVYEKVKQALAKAEGE